jgi:GNAT superfamily N-acetyltransferase
MKEMQMPEGYCLHDMTSEEGLDLKQKIASMTGAFDSEPYPLDIYRNMQCAPSYRKEFDLYTTDSAGNISSFCIVWYDSELNLGYFEPVGTDFKHRRKGLGAATLNAGLIRLIKSGTGRAYVGSAGDDRRSFYGAAGFTESAAFYPWVKELRPR